MIFIHRSILVNSLLLMIIFLVVGVNVSTGKVSVGTGVFPDTSLIDKELVRDESTQADVQRVLGIPNGSGGALLPGYGKNSEVLERYQAWYYEDIKTGNYKSDAGSMNIDIEQQILVVFFKGDKFYGYFWTSNKGLITGR